MANPLPSSSMSRQDIEHELALIAYFGDQEPKANSRGTPLERKRLRELLFRMTPDG